MDMDIRRIGLGLCLMGAAYTASANYVWADFQPKAPPAGKAAAATQNYVWADFHQKAPPAEKPAATVHGYVWAD
jgi:hypothetical protein